MLLSVHLHDVERLHSPCQVVDFMLIFSHVHLHQVLNFLPCQVRLHQVTLRGERDYEIEKDRERKTILVRDHERARMRQSKNTKNDCDRSRTRQSKSMTKEKCDRKSKRERGREQEK
jgi:hypothetical protein